MRPPDGRTRTLAVASLFGFASCGAIGAYVSRRTPTRIDVEASALRGNFVSAAVVFTRLGYWPALTGIGTLASVAGIARGSRSPLLPALVASHAASQTALAAAKLLFRRHRPDEWLYRQEMDTSFPSGHSASAVTMYAMLALAVPRTTLAPVAKTLALGSLAACMIGVPWSRLALGAHYATDVAGGLLFGAAWLCGSFAVARLLAPEDY